MTDFILMSSIIMLTIFPNIHEKVLPLSKHLFLLFSVVKINNYQQHEIT